MATNDRLSQLPVESLTSGTGDDRLSQLVVESLQPSEGVPPRVTQAGANAAQQADENYVTQTGASSAQQSDVLYVTQIGLLVIYGEAPPTPVCPGVVEGIRQDGIAAGTPASNCSGGDGTLGAPRIGATHATEVLARARPAVRRLPRRAA